MPAAMAGRTTFTYDQLCALNHDRPPARAVRKALFTHRLWAPASVRCAIRRRMNVNINTPPAAARRRHRSVRHRLQIGCLNVRSLGSKTTAVSELIVDRRMDVAVLSETWHRSPGDMLVRLTTPPGYTAVDAVRSSDPNYGGLVIALRADFAWSQIFTDPAFYLAVYAFNRFKRKKQFFMVPVVHDIIQAQALVWIGMLGYPLTPLYGMFFIAVAIYVYYWMLRVLSRPMDRRWMQSNRSVFYLSLLGVMFIVVVAFIVGVTLVEDQYFYSTYVQPVEVNGSQAMHSSRGRLMFSRATIYCGPVHPTQMLNPMKALSDEYHLDWPILAKFIKIISSDACILSVLFILAAFLYILGVRISLEIERREILLAERELERVEAKTRDRVR